MKYFPLFLLFVVVACNNSVTATDLHQSSPQETTQGFVSALQSKDFELARQYCTPTAANALMDFETNLKMVNAEEKTTLMSGFDMEVSSINCETIEGTTICKTCCGVDSTQGEWELVQQNQKWLVNTEIGI